MLWRTETSNTVKPCSYSFTEEHNMMLALANYSDSESEKEPEEETKCTTVLSKSTRNCSQPKNDLNIGEAEGNDIVCSDEDECEESLAKVEDNLRNRCVNGIGLTENIQESSEDEDSSSEESDNETESKRMKMSDQVLENPFRSSGSSWSSSSSDINTKKESVFQIAFREQEDKKAAALERHVKMTATAGAVQMINGKKICWNHRKGKCRFGHNCTFAHDTDLQGEDSKKKKT